MTWIPEKKTYHPKALILLPYLLSRNLHNIYCPHPSARRLARTGTCPEVA